MRKFNFISSLLLVAAALLVGCSSMPPNNSMLDAARSDYAAAQSNPNVINFASSELRQAGDALNQANDAWVNRDGVEKVERLTYVAKQKIALTQEVAKQRAAEQSIANAGKERDQIRLDQRTQEAERAKMAADAAQSQAALAQNQAADAQRKADNAEARNRQLEAQLTDLQAKKTERGLVITLGDVLFNTDVAQLKPEGIATVQKLAAILQQNPQRNVLVEGFTDSTGSSGHNQELSDRRANSVLMALMEMGISRDRIVARGYGEAYPISGNDNAAGRQLNRRVEIVISNDTGRIAAR